MNFKIGSILLVKKFHLLSESKDKFFIVIGECNDEVNLLSMTTSKVYFNESLIKHGEIIDRAMSLYCFEKNRVIGVNGFAFHKNTFIYHKRSIHSFSAEIMNALNIELMDCLTKEEIIDLIYSFYKRNIFQYKEVFEKTLSEMAT